MWRTLSPGFAFIVLCLSQAGLAQSGDPLSLGMQQFNLGNYLAARTQLELALRQHPKSAKLQYVLGNTYFQLGNRAQAQQAYEACLSLNPDATVSTYCQKMLSHLKPAGSPASISGAFGSGGEHAPSSDPAQAKIEARRKEIMHRAEEECDRVRKETQAQIAEAESNGNRWVRSIEKNDVHPTISKEERAAIEAESEQKMARIMGDAKRQANSIKSL
jgi:tetratricopeptide (TPR) repeat protein